MNLTEKAKLLLAEDVFLGGHPDLFDLAGRNLLMVLLREGLTPQSNVLDIGCGCLRGGYWLIHLLEKGWHFGIEPNTTMLDAGRTILLEPGLEDQKQPRFANNSDFDMSVFGQSFDFVVARSIWTHCSKQHIQTMLDGFTANSNKDGIFMSSYIKADIFRKDYQGSQWLGKSHESEKPALVFHKFDWIRRECEQRGLAVRELKEKAFNYGDQVWLRIGRQD